METSDYLTIEIGLTIPDNEAYTALTTLRKLGFDLSEVRRADLWRFVVDPGNEAALAESLLELETIYNPNKHELRLRAQARPLAGEVWIDEPGHGMFEVPVRISGRELPGVERAMRSTAWRLFAPNGEPAAPEILAAAVKMLLCNLAFQKATM